MRKGLSLGRQFGWLWAAFALSSYGTGLGFGAMAIIAIRVLHAGAGEVALLSSVGVGTGALLALPLAPWVEFRRKRPVMIAADVMRFAAQITVPVAYVLGWLTFVQLLAVTIVVAGAKISFQAASGAHLKGARHAKSAAHGEQPLRVDHLELDGRRPAARWRSRRPVRPSRDDRR